MSKECENIRKQGVGLLHDRIIFEGNHIDIAKKCIAQVKKAFAEELQKELKTASLEKNTDDILTWVNDWIRIYAVTAPVDEKQNPILVIGKILDRMELEPQFVTKEAFNPLLYLLDGAGKAGVRHNETIKKSFLVKSLSDSQKDWMLWKKDKQSIRDLPDIASGGEKNPTWKRSLYYAVLQSDGDSMGNYLASQCEKSDIKKFSTNCFKFCAAAAELIQEFGGLPIYAGGDDLLAIVPVCGTGEKIVTNLVADLNKKFNECFQTDTEAHAPTLSVGISIQYYKSPLYEALDQAGMLLHEAKSGQKNALRLNLMKHSGQSVKIAIDSMNGSEAIVNLNTVIEKLLKSTDASDASVFLSSAGYQIENFERLFDIPIRKHDRQQIYNLFDNLFDNEAQKAFEPYLTDLEKLLWSIMEEEWLRYENAGKQMCEQKATVGRSAEDAECARKQREKAYIACVIGQIKAAIRFLHFLLEKNEEKVQEEQIQGEVQ